MSYHDDPTERGWTDAQGQRWIKPPRQEPQRVPTFFVHLSGEPLPPRSKALRISGFTVAWALWFAAFLLIETWALLRKQRGDTWSEHWWSVFAVRRKVHPAVRAVLLVVQLTFGVWLVGHLAMGWWTL